MRTVCNIIIITAMLSSVLAHAQALYRWTDENGSTHYTTSPPKGKNAILVTPSTPKKQADSLAPATITPPLPMPNKEPQSDAMPSTPKDPLLAQRKALFKKNCTTARANLKILQQQKNISLLTANGQHHKLSDAQREMQLQIATKDIEYYCHP